MQRHAERFPVKLGIENLQELRSYVQADLAANARDPKARAVLVGFRTCQWLMRDNEYPRRRSLPAVALYRFLTEFLLGIELRPKTIVGSGVTIYHGFGLVVNDHAQIGSGVTLRNGVVIGNKQDGGACPVIGDAVVIGANAVIVGGIHIGANAKVGAGAVVTKDVRAGATVVGNPAREIQSGIDERNSRRMRSE